MANKNKPNAIMHRPNSNWFGNAIKSMGLTSTEIIKELMPYTSGSVESVASVAKDVRTNIRKSMSSGKTVTGQLEKNGLIQMGRNALKNAAEDLKTGNFYNNERSADLGSDFNFEDVDMSFGDDDDESSDSDGGNTVVNNVNTIDSGAILAVRDSVNKQTNATIAGATATVNTMVAVSSNMMMANQKSMSEVLEKMNSIDSNLASMLTYMNENVTKFIDASIAHYGEVSPKNDGSRSASSNDKSSSETIFSDNGFNANEYIKYVKQNFNDSTAGSMMGMLKDMAPILLGGYVANPLGEITKAVTKHMMSKDFKKSLGELDKSVQSFIPTMLERLADKAFDYENDGAKGMLMRFLGSTFGVRTPVSNKFVRRKYEAGVTPFDNETKLAITEVIPSYLRDILAEISGKEKQVFDKNEMKFRSESSMENEIYGNVFNSTVAAFNKSAVGNKLSDRKNRLDGIDRDKFEELMNRFYVNLSRQSGEINTQSMSSDEDLMKYLAGNDRQKYSKMKSEYGSIIQYFKDALDSTSIADRAGLNYAKIQSRQSVNRTKRTMEESPELYNLGVTNDGRTINQGVDAYLDRAYRGGATVVGHQVGSKTRQKYGFAALVDTVVDIQAVLHRGINVRNVSSLEFLPGDHTQYDSPIGPTLPSGQYGGSISDANQSIRDDQQVDEELHGEGQETRGHTPTKAVNRVTEILNAVVSGGPNAASNLIGESFQKAFENAGNWIDQHVLDPMSKTIFGDKDPDTGKRDGLFGGIKNSFTDMINGALHGLTGQGYTKLNPGEGEDAVVGDSEDSLAHKVGKIFSDIKSGVAEYLFGKKNEDTGEREGGGFVGSAKKVLSDGLSGWSELFFGKPEDGEDALDQAKKWAKDAVPGGVAGGAAGLFTGSLLSGSILGNIISPGLGGMIGAGVGMVTKSEKFQTWLFGKDDENGNHIAGVLSQKTQAFLKDSKNSMLGGAAVGALKSLILPSASGLAGSGLLTSFVGGPVAGMLMGAGMGLVRKTQWYQKMMYGMDDENGNHVNGIKDKIKNFFSKTGGKDGKAAGGYKTGMSLVSGLAGSGIGLLWGPTGAIIGGLMGTATGILSSSEKFKKMLFGEEDENGNRTGGALGKLGMWMDVNVMKPIQYGAGYLGVKLQASAKKLMFNFGAMLDPLKMRIGQIKDDIVYKIGEIGSGIKKGFVNVVFKPLKSAVLVATKPIKFIGKQAAKLGVTLLKAPMDALGSVFKGITKMLVPKNVRGVLKASMRDAKDALKQTFARGLKNIGGIITAPIKGVFDKFKNSGAGEAFFLKVLEPMRNVLSGGAKRIMDFIGKSVKKVLGFPFRLLGEALALPFKALGLGTKAIAKVGRLGAGALGVLTNAHKDGEDASQGMRSKFISNMRDKASSGNLGLFGMLREGARFLDPGTAALDAARNDPDNPLNDKVEVTNKNGKTKTVSHEKAMRIQNDLFDKEEENELNKLRERFDLKGIKRRAKHYGYDAKNKDQILGVQQYENQLQQTVTMKKLSETSENIKDAMDKNQESILGMAKVVERGGTPGSIYTNDVHSSGILGSIYQLLVKKFTGEDIDSSDLDKLSNQHIHKNAGEAIYKKVIGNADNNLNGLSPEDLAGREEAEENGTLDEWEATHNAELAKQRDRHRINAFSTIDDAGREEAEENGTLDEWLEQQERNKKSNKDAEEDRKRNETQNAEIASGVDKSKNFAKNYREEQAKKAEIEEDKTETSGFMKNIWEATKARTKSWFETFDLKKGVITGGIVAIGALLLPALKSLLSGQFISDIVQGVGTVVSNTFSNFSSNGGVQGTVNGFGDLGRRAVDVATFNIAGASTNANGTSDNIASTISRYAAHNGMKVAANSALTFAKSAGAITKTETKRFIFKNKKIATTVLGKKVGGVTKTISDMLNHFFKWLGSKFGKSGAKAATKIGQKLTGEVIEKAAEKGGAKIATAAAAKGIGAALSLGASELVFAAIGGIDGAIKAAQLFEVRKSDVDGLMLSISVGFGALLGTTAGTVIDIIASIVESIIGTNFIREAAQAIWAIGKTDEEKQTYANCKEAFKEDWKESAYDKYMKLETEGTKMSKEQFLNQSDDQIANTAEMTKNDYNVETNKDLFGHIGSFFGGIWDWMTGKKDDDSTSSSNAELINTNWAGGVVKGNKPILSMLSPGEIVVNPANPSTMQKQKLQEESARNRIYSRINTNATVNDLSSPRNGFDESDSIASNDLYGTIRNGYLALNHIVTILNGIYSKMFGRNSFNYTTVENYKSDIAGDKGLTSELADTVSGSIEDAMVSNDSDSEKVAVKDPKTGAIRYMNKEDVEANDEDTDAGRGRGEAPTTKQVGNATLYQQEDPAWNDNKFKKLNIYDSGCGPTAASIAASVYGSTMNPVSAASIINQSGYRTEDGGTMPQGIAQAGSKYGIDMHEGAASSSAIMNNLKHGKPVIFMGQDGIGGRGSESVYGDGMHYVVGTGIDPMTGNVQILDPLKSNPESHPLRSFLKNTVSTIYTGTKSNRGRRSANTRGGRGVNPYNPDIVSAIFPKYSHDSITNGVVTAASHWMSSDELNSFLKGINDANRDPADENEYYKCSYNELLNKSFDWVPGVDEFLRDELSPQYYDSLVNAKLNTFDYLDNVPTWDTEDAFDPIYWISPSNLKKYYGIDDWKAYYKYAARNMLLNQHILGNSNYEEPLYKSILKDLPIEYIKTESDATKIKDVIYIITHEMRLSEKIPSASLDAYLSQYYKTDQSMNEFLRCAFGDDAGVIVPNYNNERIHKYVEPLYNYKIRMDGKVTSFCVSMTNEAIDACIAANADEFSEMSSSMSGSSFDTVSTRESIFKLFAGNTNTISTYMAKQYDRLVLNPTFNNFINRIVNRSRWIELPAAFEGTNYLSGQTLSVTGTAAQCDLIRIALTLLNSLQYSQKDRMNVEGGYADSAGAISYLYSSIGLPIPSTGPEIYTSGKSLQIYGPNDIDSSLDSEIVETLYAGDVLLYTGIDDQYRACIRHVEIYAGDGLMLGHSGGSNGSTRGFHACNFTSSYKNLKLCSVQRFIKMEDCVLHNVVFDIDAKSFTVDDEEPTNWLTSIFDKITGFLAEVASRVWNGLLTGSFDSDYSSYFGTSNGLEHTDAEYACNWKDGVPDFSGRTESREAAIEGSVAAPVSVINENGQSIPTNVTELPDGTVQNVDTGEIVPTESLVIPTADFKGFSDWQMQYLDDHRSEFISDSSYTPGEWNAMYNAYLDSLDSAGQGRGRKRRRGSYGRGNKYTSNGQTVKLPKGLGWFRVNEPWSAITAASPQLTLKSKVSENQNGQLYDDDGYAKIGNRYVVATTETFGDPGDFIDIEQSNGTKVDAVIGDIKAWGVNSLEGKHVNKWGHNDGDAILEFLKDSNSSSMRTNPSDPGDPHYNEWKGSTVTSITNRGNYLRDGKNPLSSTGELSAMSYPITKHGGTPGANTLSPLSEGYEEWRAENGVAEGATSIDGSSVYDDPDATYKYNASLTSGTYNGSTSQSYYSSQGSSSGESPNDESGMSLDTISNFFTNAGSQLQNYFLHGSSLDASSLWSGASSNSGTAGSNVNRGTALPSSLLNANSEYGDELAAQNAAMTSSNRSALYDPTLYESTERADGWFLNKMPYSSKSSSFGEDYIKDGKHLWTPCHKGIDIAAGTGTKIYTPVDGKIASIVDESAGSGFGNYVTIIDKDKNYRHIFAHQNQFASGLREGMDVKRGDLIGYVGTTGYSTGPHLHYQVNASNNSDSYINPNAFPYSIYSRSSSSSDEDTTEALETDKNNLPKGASFINDLKRKKSSKRVSAVRSESNSSNSNHSMSKGGGSGELNTVSTAKLETLTETMITILNTIADNTLSSSQKLDNIKSTASNLKHTTSSNAGSSGTSPSSSYNSSNSQSAMSTNERFARKIAKGY